jgi:conjugal transfer pilus assembly protein TraB
MIKEGARAKEVKKKQLLIAGAAALIVLVLAGGAALFVSNSAPATGSVAGGPAQPETKPIVTGAAAFNDKEAWRQQLSAEIAALRKERQDEKSQEAANARAKAANEAQRAASPVAPPPPPGAVPAPAGEGNTGSVFSPPLPPPPPQAEAPRQGRSGATPPPQSTLGSPLFTSPNAAPVPPPGGGEGGRGTIGSIRFDDTAPAQPGGAAPAAGGAAGAAQPGANLGGEDGSGGSADRRRAGSYIPAGTFARIVVLNGLDAPTGGQAQNNPSPVLLKILDSATMPNGYKANLAGCVITANGYGDVSSERSYIRLDRLTCVSEDGGAIDIAIKGYVAGEDGKSGMRGKLVSKTGQILANGLLAAVGSGIGQAFSSSATTTTTNPFGGQTATTNPGKEFQAGVGKGVGSAFEGLSKYYIQLAEKTFPIIEIDGGRVSDVVFSRGFILEGR